MYVPATFDATFTSTVHDDDAGICASVKVIVSPLSSATKVPPLLMSQLVVGFAGSDNDIPAGKIFVKFNPVTGEPAPFVMVYFNFELVPGPMVSGTKEDEKVG